MSEKTSIFVWISKYALTKGLYQAEVVEVYENENMVKTKGSFTTYFHRNEWHRDLADAQRVARSMCDRKIGSIKKQLLRLQGMTFETTQNGGEVPCP